MTGIPILLSEDSKAKKVIYGTSSFADFAIRNISYDLSGTKFSSCYGKGRIMIYQLLLSVNSMPITQQQHLRQE
jgi:hypothetical protein